MIELLIFGLLLLTIICLWLIIERRKNYAFLFYFIPFFLIITLSVYWTYTSILGLSKIGYPTKGLYLSHYVDEPDWIYLWILQKGVPISYKIIYNRLDHESLEGVKAESEEGEYMMLSKMDPGDGDGKKEKGKKGSGYTLGGDMNFYKWKHQQSLYRKEKSNK